MEFESKFRQPTPEEKVMNYESDVNFRVQLENGQVMNRILGNYLTEDKRIVLDALVEDKVRQLAREGLISNGELEVFIRSNLSKSKAGIFDSGLSPGNVIEGVFKGIRCYVVEVFAGKHGWRTYKGMINGEKIDSNTASIIYAELEKEYKILEKIKNKNIENLIRGK